MYTVFMTMHMVARLALAKRLKCDVRGGFPRLLSTLFPIGEGEW